MITLFLESSLFEKDKEDYTFTCKLSFRDKDGKYHNKIVKEDSYDRDSEMKEDFQEVSSLLVGLKQIKLDNLKNIKTIRIISSYKEGMYLKNSIGFLFDSWEYIDFRGVPYKELWLEIHSILTRLYELGIKLLIKEK